MQLIFRLLPGLAIALGLTVGALPPVAAQTSVPAPAATGMTLREALTLVIETNPKLQGYRYAVARAEARRDQSALRPQIEVGADVENVLGTGNIGTFNDAEITLRIGTALDLGDKRQFRIVTADRERELVLLEQEGQRLDLLAQVARRFIDLLAAQERVTLAREHFDRKQEATGWVRQRRNAGLGTVIEESSTSIALIDAQIKVSEAETTVREAWASLTAAWGGAPESAGEARGNLLDLPPLPAYADIAARAERNPSLVGFAGERRLAEARLRSVQAGRSADISVRAGIRRLERLNDQALIFGASIPLGQAGRNGAFEREAESRLSEIGFNENAARAEVLATLFGLVQQANQARHAAQDLTQTMRPTADQALREVNSGFQAGRFTYVELALAQEQVHDTDERRVSAAQKYHHAIIEIERLTGEAIGAAMGTGGSP